MELKNMSRTTWIRMAVVAGVAIAGIVVTVLVVYAIPEGRFMPEIALTLILLSGVVTFVAVLVCAVVLLAKVGLSNRTHAFGMPEGTIRAVIALSLVFAFSIISVFLYGQLRSDRTSLITDLTKEQRDSIPIETLVSSWEVDTDSGLYNARVRLLASEASEDFASQLLTTISTLVVAVAGFYFGTRAVSVARETKSVPLPVLRSLEPASGRQGQEIEVEITGRNLDAPESILLVLGSSHMTIQGTLWSETKVRGELTIPGSQPPGSYELVVRTKGGGEDRLPGALEVRLGSDTT